jgi:hypothetical protein
MNDAGPRERAAVRQYSRELSTIEQLPDRSKSGAGFDTYLMRIPRKKTG